MKRKLMTILILAFAALGASAGTVYVDASATGDGSGGDWENACTTLADAVAKATGTGDEIHVKGDLSQTAVVTIASHAGLAIRGGYTGEDETTRSGRSLVARNTKAGTFRIFDVSASTVTFDGLEIKSGCQNANNEMGHGVRASGTSAVTFTNCCFNANGLTPSSDKWTSYGGAIGATDGTLTVVDCEFKGNYLKYGNHFNPYGGAIYAKNESVSIVNSRFNKNYCQGGWDTIPYGGAIMLSGCTQPVIDNCTFTTNYIWKNAGSSSVIGGTLCLSSCTDAKITNCRVLGGYMSDSSSVAVYTVGGQAFYFANSTVSLTRSVFYNVGAGGASGRGVIDVSGATSRLFMTNVLVSTAPKSWCLGNNNGVIEAVNCTFTGTTNADLTRNYPAYMQNGGTASFANCLFWNLVDGRSYVKAGTEPTFTDCTDGTVDPLFADTLYCHPQSQAGRYDGGWFDGGTWVADAVTSPSIDGVAGLRAVANEPQPNGHHLNIGYDGDTAVASKSYVDEDPYDPDSVQVVTYPDYETPDSSHIVVHGTLNGTGEDATANVYLLWDNADRGKTFDTWAHKISCGAFAANALVSATMENPSGTVYYRLYAENGHSQVDWSSPARSVKTPAPPTIAYATPEITYHYRTSVRVNVTLVDDVDLASTVSVSYFPTDDPSVTNTVFANDGTAVAVGATYVDLTGLSVGTEYTYFASASNAIGRVSLADRTVTTRTTDETMTLSAAPTAAGIGDGTGFANATTIANAFAQATVAGDEIRLLAGEYTIATPLTVTDNANMKITGGYTGEGDARDGRARLVRYAKLDESRQILDISASTVTVDAVSIEKGFVNVADAIGQGVRMRNNSDVTFTNCSFVANGGTSDWGGNYNLYGGGIGASGGKLTILDCDFDGNVFSRNAHLGGNGAGAYATDAAVTIRNSRFRNNYEYNGWDLKNRGGALAFQSCKSVEIDGCLFATNTVSRQKDLRYTSPADGAPGGAISLLSCTNVTITDSQFYGGGVINVPSGGADGGYAQLGLGHAIEVWNSKLALSRSVFTGVGDQGATGSGVIDVYGSSAELHMTNVLMTAMKMGWAVGNAAGGTVEAVNCTFHRTYKSGTDADVVRRYTGYSQFSDCTTTFDNCIFWDLTNGVSYVKEGDEPLFTNCNRCETDPLFGDTTHCHPMSRGGRYVGGYFTGGGFTTNDVVTSPAVDAVSDFVAAGLATEPQPNGCRVNQGYDGNTEVASKSDLGDDPVVDATKLQIFSYPDRAAESSVDITAYGTVASTGGSATDSVTMYLLWGDKDEGEDESKWDHKVNCGLCAPWETASGTMRNVAGTAWYRFYAENADRGTSAYSAPARSFVLPEKPTLAYGDPAITHVYRRSLKVHLDLQATSDLDTTVRVVYWPTQSPEQEQTVYANYGQAVPTGAVEIAVSALTPGVEYTIRGEANNMMGTTALAEQTVKMIALDEPLTLVVAPEAAGRGDGFDWANASTLANATAQTVDGGELRLKTGTYALTSALTVSGHPGLKIVGGYTGEGEARSGRSLITRDTSMGQFRLFDISASTVTVSSVTIEKGHVHIKGELGHAMRITGHSDVTVTNCVFANNGGEYGNQWSEYGIAIGAKDSTLHVAGCDFSDNYSTYNNNFAGVGGALYASKTSLSVVNSQFNRNWGHDGWNGPTKGGAIALENCVKPYFGGCSFTTNHVSKVAGQTGNLCTGGTLWMSACTGALIENCTVTGGYVTYNNTTPETYVMNGTVFKFLNSTATILNTAIRNVGESGDAKNPSTSSYGVIDVEGGALAMTNVLMAGTTKCWGIGNKGGVVSAVNCTIAGISQNTSNRTYAAYVQNASGAATFENMIYWDVLDGVAYTTGGNEVTNNYCAAETALEGKGNVVLASSPFTDAAAGDYTLNPTSRCVNVGRNSAALRRMTDLEGNPRVRHGKVDLGAYESDYYRGFLLLVK